MKKRTKLLSAEELQRVAKSDPVVRAILEARKRYVDFVFSRLSFSFKGKK